MKAFHGETSRDSATNDSGDGLRVRIRRKIWGACPYVPQKTYARPAMIRDAGLPLQSHILGVSQRGDGGVDLDVCRFRGMADQSLSFLIWAHRKILLPLEGTIVSLRMVSAR
jgi:hypothetical protein